MSSLTKAYREYCSSPGNKERPFIRGGLEKLEEVLQSTGRGLLVLELPTAYGKSTATFALASMALRGNCYFDRVIHVLPMRSICKDLGDRLRKGGYPKVGIQYMANPGSPFFAKRILVTTFDTFVLNFFKLPATELSKLIKSNMAHFEFPRAMIYSSIVVMDEVHLFSPLGKKENAENSVTTFLAALGALVGAGVPVILLTATMPEGLLFAIREEINKMGFSDSLVEVRYEPGIDLDYDEERSRKSITVEEISEEDVKSKVERLCGEEKKRGMLISNSVNRACQLYNLFRDSWDGVVLFHGKMPEVLRSENYEKIEKAKLLVATQVVESGINVSFDFLITEACPADRLIQRAGRVAREKESVKGEVFVYREEGGSPYEQGVVKNTLDALTNFKFLTPENGRDFINAAYGGSQPSINSNMLKSLRSLDKLFFLGKKDPFEVLKYYNGLTDSFGIISGYASNAMEEGWAISLSNEEALRYLATTKAIIRNRGDRLNIENVDQTFIQSSYPNRLWLSLLEKDGSGILVPEIDKRLGVVIDGNSR